MDIPPPPGPQQPPPGGAPQPGPYQPYETYPGSYAQPGGYPGGPAGPPYQAWPGGYQPYVQPPVNGLAIASLVLGILCFVPGLGLVLGAVGLSQINRRGERGRGMAIAGIVLSSLGLMVLALGLIGILVGDDRDGGGSAGGGPGGEEVTFSLDVGECFDTQGRSLEGLAYDVDRVPCSGAHDGEVFANFTLPGGPWPGEKRLDATADDKCFALRRGYAMDSWALPADSDVYHFSPSRESWDYGDREITCLFGNADATGRLTGPLRNDEGSLDADQTAYLKALRATEEALENPPEEEYVEDDLPGHRRWAREVAAALGDQERALRDHRWPTRAADAIAAELRAVKAARTQWDKAAEATDADTFYEAYGAADEAYADREQIPARKALGLVVTPPEREDGGEGEEGGSGGTGGSGSGSGGAGTDRKSVV